MKLGLIFVSLGLIVLIITIFSDGRQLLKYFRYKGKCTAGVVEVRPFTVDDSRNAVEELQPDGSWKRLHQTEDRAVQLRPYGFLLFDNGKPMTRFAWRTEEHTYRGNYRYLHRKPTWQVGDAVELHYDLRKPWQFAVEDPRLPGLIVRNAMVSLLIFAIGIGAMTFVQDSMSRKDTAPNRDHAALRMQEAQPVWDDVVLSRVDTNHGEDYEIVWEDPGMEAHIRYLLGKEEGPVRHSDVWNAQVLTLRTNVKMERGGFDFSDVILTDPENPDNSIRHPYSGKQFPEVKSFRDLRHFDSLQRLESNLPPLTKSVYLDLSGLGDCGLLREIALYYVCPESLAPLSGMKNLESLTLTLSDSAGLDLSQLKDLPALRILKVIGCEQADLTGVAALPVLEELQIEESGQVDLTPLADAASLKKLTVFAGSVASLEPLTKCTQLHSFAMRMETLPNLEPLTRTGVEYLDLSLDFMTQGRYGEANYEPLTRMQNLISLNMEYHKMLDFESCLQIVEGNPGLRYLDVSYTPAAKRSGDLPDENILALVDILK